MIHRLGYRRLAILALLLVLAVGAITARDTWTTTGQPAQAGVCFTRDATWAMQSGAVPVRYGKVHFGATVCLADDGVTIASVSPFLSGGVEGAGTTAGFSWDNRGAWVQSQARTFAEVRGSAKAKLCLARVLPFCSLTDTQTFTLRVQTAAGPYRQGTEPGIWASSRTCDATGCYPGTRFTRL